MESGEKKLEAFLHKNLLLISRSLILSMFSSEHKNMWQVSFFVAFNTNKTFKNVVYFRSLESAGVVYSCRGNVTVGRTLSSKEKGVKTGVKMGCASTRWR